MSETTATCHGPLLIAGASVRAAAQSAVRAGFTVTAADLFGDRDLAAIAVTHSIEDYPEAIRAIADSCRRWNGCIPAAWKTIPIWWMPSHGATVCWAIRGTCCDRPATRGNWWRRCNRRGLPVPGAAPQLSRVPDERWLIKPLAGSGGGEIRELPSPRSRALRRTGRSRSGQ